MGDPFTLRHATADDIELLIELRFAMVRELAGEVELDEANGNPRDYFTSAVPSGEYVCLLAEANGKVIGIGGMAVRRKPPHPLRPAGIEGYILNMLTLPDWRGRGVASAIVEGLLKHARELGADVVSLNASRQGRPVYEKFGFAENPHYMELKLEGARSEERGAR